MGRIETVIIGAGQAGLAISYCLNQNGKENIVLERASRPANAWRNRWDSFTLVTPNWTMKIPGAEYTGPDSHGFLPRDKIVEYFENYVERFQIPALYNTNVSSIESINGKGYRIQTNEKTFEAKNIVIAAGGKPKIPEESMKIPADINQIHSSEYRNPESIPEGAVLVIGSAQSGCQIAEELYQNGKKVFLCTCSAGRVPRRYRGKDVVEWLSLTGFFDLTPDKLPFPKEHFAPPHVSGAKGGHNLNLHQFAKDGVTLLGHFKSINDGKIIIAPDLYENLGKADQAESMILKMIDGFIMSKDFDSPAEEVPQLKDGFRQPIIEELDLKKEGINNIIWATGYKYNFNFLKLPVFDAQGFPIQSKGVADRPGLYFAGMTFMPSIKTGMLTGVGEYAEFISSHISERKN